MIMIPAIILALVGERAQIPIRIFNIINLMVLWELAEHVQEHWPADTFLPTSGKEAFAWFWASLMISFAVYVTRMNVDATALFRRFLDGMKKARK